MAISKKIRFEVFKRDGFKCAYCGKEPPAVMLEVDHIDPKSKGGKDDLNNLLTACFDCNRGKRDIPLDAIPQQLQDNLEVLQQKEEQLKEYRRFIARVQKRENKDIEDINNIYSEGYPGWEFNENFKTSVRMFLKNLPKHQVAESLQVSILKFPENTSDNRINCTRYFCGICWNKIKSIFDPDYASIKELERYWKNQKRGSGYLNESYLRAWIHKYDIEIIRAEMDRAGGLWVRLKKSLEGEES